MELGFNPRLTPRDPADKAASRADWPCVSTKAWRLAPRATWFAEHALA